MKRLRVLLGVLFILMVVTGCKGKQEEATEASSVKKSDEKKEKNDKSDKKSGVDLKSIFSKDKKEGETEEDPSEPVKEKEEPVSKKGFTFQEYEYNQVVDVDLDGDGKKEAVQLQMLPKKKTAKDEEEYYPDFEAYLNINGQALEYFGNMNNAIMVVADMDPSDSYLEIFTAVSEYETYHDVRCYHYKNNKLEELFFSDDCKSFPRLNVKAVTSDGVLEIEGEGVFSYVPDMDNLKDLGQYFTKTEYILKDGILVYLGSNRYERTSDSWRKECPYYLTVDGIEVFDSVNGSRIGELNKGDVFYLYAVKRFNESYDENYAGFIYKDAWAEIRTDKGVQGWIEIPWGYFYTTDPSNEYPSPYHWG